MECFVINVINVCMYVCMYVGMDGMYGMDGTVWCGMVRYGLVWFGTVWYGMFWYGTVRYGTVRYGMYVCMYVYIYNNLFLQFKT